MLHNALLRHLQPSTDTAATTTHAAPSITAIHSLVAAARADPTAATAATATLIDTNLAASPAATLLISSVNIFHEIVINVSSSASLLTGAAAAAVSASASHLGASSLNVSTATTNPNTVATMSTFPATAASLTSPSAALGHFIPSTPTLATALSNLRAVVLSAGAATTTNNTSSNYTYIAPELLSPGGQQHLVTASHVPPSLPSPPAVDYNSTLESAAIVQNITGMQHGTTAWSDGADFVALLTALSWQHACLLAFFTTLIVVTVLGNTLVILAVYTTRRLRTVTNFFVMSLAVADWLVGVFVMPPSVLLYLYGSWNVGWILCDIWISLDILLCTASILSLCAISLDRYLAVTRPLSYKKRRTKRLALFMICMVWVLALAITCPPILGWYEPGRRKPGFQCRYNQNKGYVVFSAMGSFFIPMTVMLYVYTRICWVLASRRSRMTHTEALERNLPDGLDNDHITSECESTIQHHPAGRHFSIRRTGSGGSHQQQQQQPQQQHHHYHHHHLHHHHQTIIHQKTSLESTESRHTLYELVEISKSTSSTIRTSSTITNYKFTTTTATAAAPSTAAATTQPLLATAVAQQRPPNCCQQQQKPQSAAQQPAAALAESTECLSAGRLQRNFQLLRQHSMMSGGLRATAAAGDPKRMPIRISTSKRESKAAKTLSTVVGGFIACWLPFFVYYLLIPFLPRAHVSEPAMTVLTWLGWVNSAINPFIYAFYNSDFRLAFWRLTFRKMCKGSPNRNQWH